MPWTVNTTNLVLPTLVHGGGACIQFHHEHRSTRAFVFRLAAAKVLGLDFVHWVGENPFFWMDLSGPQRASHLSTILRVVERELTNEQINTLICDLSIHVASTFHLWHAAPLVPKWLQLLKELQIKPPWMASIVTVQKNH